MILASIAQSGPGGLSPGKTLACARCRASTIYVCSRMSMRRDHKHPRRACNPYRSLPVLKETFSPTSILLAEERRGLIA